MICLFFAVPHGLRFAACDVEKLAHTLPAANRSVRQRAVRRRRRVRPLSVGSNDVGNRA